MTESAHPREARRPARGLPILAAAGLAVALFVRGLALGPQALPDKLSDEEFWRLSSTFSEAGGTFPSKNYVSNEVGFQSVIPALRQTVSPGGVYVGVGPDQNFTYISALQPGVAFIVDIRRENLLHHLLYKALIELSPDRASFVERLFSRPRLPDDPAFENVKDLMDAAAARAPSDAFYRQNLRDVLEQLRQRHGFPITPDDQRELDSIYSAFYRFGPEITYAPLPPMPDGWLGPVQTPFPSFAALVAQADNDGVNWSYLATEAHYARVRDLQLRNLVVPVVGDFAGPKALRAVGDWARARDAAVTTIYASNVEQYLFQNGVWRDFYANVAALPLDETSTFIRSFFPSGAFIRGPARVVTGPNGRRVILPPPLGLASPWVESDILLDPVRALLDAVDSSQVHDYLDVIHRSR